MQIVIALRLLMFCALMSCSGSPRIVNDYGSPMGIDGRMRAFAHTGIDYDGELGDPVLAAYDGVVAAVVQVDRGVGKCILLEHRCVLCSMRIFYTSYCHLEKILVSPGAVVARGSLIGGIGMSGLFAGRVPHLHFSMCRFPCVAAVRDGDVTRSLNPKEFLVGCFDMNVAPRGGQALVLTHPVACN